MKTTMTTAALNSYVGNEINPWKMLLAFILWMAATSAIGIGLTILFPSLFH